MTEIRLKNLEETHQLAKQMGKRVVGGDVIVLTGELGTGKTTFTKGLAEGLGVTEMVKSPTYTLIREYQSGRLTLYHMDVYRLEEGGEGLGLEEYFEDPTGVSVVEWGENIVTELPPSYLELVLSYTEDINQRKLEYRAYGTEAQEILKRLS